MKKAGEKMLYLQDENHLLIGVVPEVLMDGDEVLTYIFIRANYHMTGQELLDLALETWNLQDDGKRYHFVTVRPHEEAVVPLEQNLKEIGLSNGDPLKIVVS